jgi:hypothetical protein
MNTHNTLPDDASPLLDALDGPLIHSGEPMPSPTTQDMSEAGPIDNIAKLFDALAASYESGARNRFLIAGIGGQFIRTPESGRVYPFYEPGFRDIPVLSAPYDMKGFLQFDANILFRGMFSISRADDGVWLAGELTDAGYEYARAGVFDYNHDHPDISVIRFLSPSVRAITKEPALPQPPTPLPESAKENEA